MSIDKYLEKMVLIPIERWEQLLKNEKEIICDSESSISEDDEEEDSKSPFPITEKSSVKDDKGKDKEDKEDIRDINDKLAPPGIPTSVIIDIKEEDQKTQEDCKPSEKKKRKIIKNTGHTLKTIHWKKLP